MYFARVADAVFLLRRGACESPERHLQAFWLSVVREVAGVQECQQWRSN